MKIEKYQGKEYKKYHVNEIEEGLKTVEPGDIISISLAWTTRRGREETENRIRVKINKIEDDKIYFSETDKNKLPMNGKWYTHYYGSAHSKEDEHLAHDITTLRIPIEE